MERSYQPVQSPALSPRGILPGCILVCDTVDTMAATTTVRVRPDTRAAIARLSERRGVSTADLLDELVIRAEEDELLGAMNDDFGRLRTDEAAWQRLLEERSTWEQTLLDGLRQG